MTNEDIQVAVAEAHGWTHIKRWTDGPPSGYPITAAERMLRLESGADPLVPDYLVDMNACNDLIDLRHKQGWACVLVAQSDRRCCTFVKSGVEHKVIADTFPEAICESFLRSGGKWKDHTHG